MKYFTGVLDLNLCFLRIKNVLNVVFVSEITCRNSNYVRDGWCCRCRALACEPAARSAQTCSGRPRFPSQSALGRLRYPRCDAAPERGERRRSTPSLLRSAQFNAVRRRQRPGGPAAGPASTAPRPGPALVRAEQRSCLFLSCLPTCQVKISQKSVVR